MIRNNSRWVVVLTVVVCIGLAWAPASVAAGHALAVASIHETDTELSNANELTNLTVTGTGSTAYATPNDTITATLNNVDENGDGTAENSRAFAGDTSSDTALEREWKVANVNGGNLTEINVNIDNVVGSDYDPTVEVYVQQEDTPDGIVDEGTKVATWDPTFATGVQTITLDTPIDLTAGENYSIGFVTTSTDNDGTNDRLDLATDEDSVSGTWEDGDGGSNSWLGDIRLSTKQDGYPATYISQNHSVTDPEEGFVNVTLDNASATITWEAATSGTWTTVNSTTVTSTGNHTLDLSTTSADTWRVNVTFQNTTTMPTARLHDEGLLFTPSAPSASNTAPSDGSTLTTSSVDIEVDVNDSDFTTSQGDTVTANLYIDGSKVEDTTTTSNGTVTITRQLNNGGDHTYYWTLNDSYGESTSTSTNTVTVPDTLYIYNETQNSTGQHELLDDATIDITATITGSNQTVFETTVNNGKINFTNLPADETYIITLESNDFYTREVYVSSIYDQDAVFLLNTSIPSVRNDISVNDRTGRYSDNPIIIVDRVINTTNVSQLSDSDYEWVAIGGDRLGASQVYTIDLQQDARYRFRVINQQGDTRVLGEYTAKSSGSITLEIGAISYDLSPDGKAYEWATSIENTSTGGQLTFSYNDPANQTTELNLTIRYRNNSSILTQQTFTSGPYGEITYTQPLSQNEYENESFIIEWNATRNSSSIDGQAYEGTRQRIDLPLSNIWLQVGYAGLILSFAFLVGAGVSAGAGSMVVISFAGFGWFIGIVPNELGAGAVVLGLLIAAIQHMLTQNPTTGAR